MFCKNIEISVPSEGSGYIEGTPVAVLQVYVEDGYVSERVKTEGRPAVIVCPGSGFRKLCEREAEPVALRFLAAGMQTFVLRHSVAPCKFPCAMLQLASAVSLVREHAAEWNIDPHRVFVCGFSAGGHVCALLGTRWNDPCIRNILGIDALNVRPDGMILGYPVITFGEFGHPGSIKILLGENPSEEARKALSVENFVTDKTPPAFLWHTLEDAGVPVENSLLFARALRSCGVPFELHVYEKGIHGMALCDDTTDDPKHQPDPDSAGWVDLAVRWIRRRKIGQP